MKSLIDESLRKKTPGALFGRKRRKRSIEREIIENVFEYQTNYLPDQSTSAALPNPWNLSDSHCTDRARNPYSSGTTELESLARIEASRSPQNSATFKCKADNGFHQQSIRQLNLLRRYFYVAWSRKLTTSDANRNLDAKWGNKLWKYVCEW